MTTKSDVPSTAVGRLPPIPVGELSEEARAALRTHMKQAADLFLSGAPDAPRMPNVLAVLLHHPALAGPWLTYNGVLLGRPSIEPRQRELMILRVAWCTRSDYEWLQHVRLGKQLGITDEEILALTRGDGAWSPLEADLLAATDQLLEHHRIDDATWARLSEHFEPRQLVEIVFVVGTYACLAMAFNSFGLEPDPDLDPSRAPALPSRSPRPDSGRKR